MAVYFVEIDGFIKIGIAQDVKARFSGIQGSSPHEATLLASAPGDEATERALHLRFATSHHKGEWYRSTPELRELIAATLTCGEVPGAIYLHGTRRSPPLRLTALLRKHRLPRKDLASYAGIGAPTLGTWASGQGPTYAAAIVLAFFRSHGIPLTRDELCAA